MKPLADIANNIDTGNTLSTMRVVSMKMKIPHRCQILFRSLTLALMGLFACNPCFSMSDRLGAPLGGFDHSDVTMIDSLSDKMLLPDGLVPTPISYGQTLAATLSTPTEVDEFTFFGNANDVVFVMMSGATLGFDAEVRLFHPNGSLLGLAQGVDEAILRRTLPVDGIYMIRASEWGQGDSGPYGLHLQRLNDPVGAVEITYGQTRSGVLSPRGDADAYLFDGLADERIFAMNTAGTVSMDPILDLYDGQGNLLRTHTSATEAIIRYDLPADDQYLLLVRESNVADVGPYGIHLQRLSNPVDGEAIAFGQTLTRNLSPAGDADIYSFSGHGGSQVRVRVTENNQLSPLVELYDAGGILLASAGGVGVIDVVHTLPGTGDYRILVHEQNAGDTGLYTVGLELLFLPPLMRYVATVGNDSMNDCTNALDPCATMGHAVSQANDGDTIDLAAGTYTEPGLVIEKNLIIQGQGVVVQ